MKTLRLHPTLLLLALGAALAGCSSVPSKTAESGKTAQAPEPVTPPYKGGGYYKNDGPGANPPANLAGIPSATPRWEPLHRYANDAYKVMGRTYQPVTDRTDYKAKGLASWYGRKFHGKPTSTGEPYDMYAMTAAHATLPLPSYARVTNLENGKSVVVRVNDRGPFHAGRIIDLSYTAAYQLDMLNGPSQVEVASVLPETAPTSFTAQAEETFVPLPRSATPDAAASEPATPAPVAAAQAGKLVYLQLGAFANPVAAEDLLARASAKLSRSFPGVMRLQANGLYKIHAGPFASAEEADRAATSVQADLGVKAFKVIAEAPAQPAATSLAKPAEPASATPGLYLQLGALSNADAADALANQVKNRFGADLPGIHQVTAGSLYKVQAGPFASAAAAEQLALAYQQDFGVKPYRVLR